MILISSRRRRVGLIAILALTLLVPSPDLMARGGGQRWGYRPPAGNPLTSIWLYASPYAALSGWSIPHHSLDGPGRGSPSSNYGGINYGGGSGAPLNTLDRSVAFPGASSNLSTALPSFSTPVPSEPYRTEKQFDPPYYINYNGYWYHGYWGGGKWGWGRWGGPAGIASFPRWSFGPLYYVSGYGTFRNPFISGPAQRSFLDYSQPIEDIEDDDEPDAAVTSTNSGAAPPNEPSTETADDRLKYLVKTPEVKAGLKAFDAADEAFKKKDYEGALQKIDEALEQLPDDTALHEFRGLILFARGDYQAAAATIYAVLAVSPGWDWTTLGSRYADQEEYARQLRALEAYHKEHADSAAAALLRGYHYTSCRHYEAAVKQFQKAVSLVPDDDFLPGLAALVAGAVEKSPQVASPAPSAGVAPSPAPDRPQDRDLQPIAKARLTGEWTAHRGGTSIALTIRDDGRFVWAATRDGKSRRIAGHFARQGNVLFLGGGSGTLVGLVEMNKQGGFVFTLPDISPGNKGLDFTSDVRK